MRDNAQVTTATKARNKSKIHVQSPMKTLSGEGFKKIYLVVFRIFEKARKIESCPKNIVRVDLFSTKKKNQEKFMVPKRSLKIHFGITLNQYSTVDPFTIIMHKV